MKNRSRLSLHNEELQWKLKQNSEKFTTALNELSKSYHDRSNFLTDCKNSLYGSILETSHDSASPKDNNTTVAGNISPPSSPVVKGVVEKSDSVSWVLEINDDESPEAMASRIVKRAGSFRGSLKERSPPFRRQLSLGPNVLSQSASATSIYQQRQHSESSKSSGSSRQVKSARNRSISLSANEPKNLRRSPSESMACGYSKWQQSLQCQASSSPLMQRNLITLVNCADATNNVKTNSSSSSSSNPDGEKVIDSRTRSNSISDEVDVVFPLLNQINEPVIDDDLSLLPAHKTVQKLKKRQQIKESAGEAMVSEQSYANSEDDQSFGSDIDSMSASSTTTSPSHSESNTKHLRNHFAIDEETFMNKIVASLNSTRSTPMEVSWSEDADNDPYAHESSA